MHGFLLHLGALLSSAITQLSMHDLLQNGQWSRWHYVFAAISPVLMTMLMLLAVKGWEGFTIFIGKVPLAAILAVIGRSLHDCVASSIPTRIFSSKYHQLQMFDCNVVACALKKTKPLKVEH